MIIEAKMGGHFVHRMYMDGGSSSKIRRNLDIFAWKPTDMTGVPRHIVEHRLNIHEGCLLVRQKKRGQAHERNKVIYEEVEKLVNTGILKEVHYHIWLSNPVMVKKHDGSWRMCVDLIYLNKACPKDGYPLLEIDWKVESLSGNLEVYVDDLVIKSRTEQEVIRDNEEMFKTLKEINKKLNPKKCTFGMREGTFLGYKVNADGLKVCPDMVEAVLSLPSPKCLKDVQRVNGKLVSLNRFLSKSTKKSLPFFKTLKKCTKKSNIQWTTKVETAFKQMKKIDSRVAYVNRTKRERKINHLPDGCKGSCQCSPNDEKGRETSTHLLRQPCITRSKNQLHSNGEADTCSADFILELPEDDPSDTPIEDEEEFLNPWILFIDGSSGIDSLILTNPKEIGFTYSLRFRFNATNNEVEYEALVAGLRIAEQMRVKNLQANVDSWLVANQVNGTYIAKEPGMIKYLEKVRTLTNTFKEFSIKQVPREENKKADAISKMASTSFAHLSKQVLVEELKKTVDEKEVLAVVEEEGCIWMTPIHEYLMEEILLEEKRKARTIHRKAGRYAVTNGILYKKSFLGPWLRCVGPLQANYVLREIHEGSCSMHAGPRSVVEKALRSGYYWPTIPFPEGLGKTKFLIVVIDYFTKWIEAKPVAAITGMLCFRQTSTSQWLGRKGKQELGKGIKARSGDSSRDWHANLKNTKVNMIKNDEDLEIT
nr:reverse transcriptase domain-containing protein [Tanacetum cinerariifolium]